MKAGNLRNRRLPAFFVLGAKRRTVVNRLLAALGIVSLLGTASVSSAQENDAVAVTLDTVVITATRGEKSVREAPGSVTVITKEDIEKRPSLSMSTLLNTIPGFNMLRGNDFSMATANTSMRGISGFRTQIMMDGIPLLDARTNEPRLDGLSPHSIQQIEAVKGPMSALYGSGMSGVVNIITRMPEEREILFRTGYGSGFSRGSAHDDVAAAYFSYGDKITDSLSFLLSYDRKETNGFANQIVTSSSRPANGPYKPNTTAAGAANYIIGDRGDQTVTDEAFTVKLQYEFSPDTKLRLNFFRTELEVDYDVPHDLTGAPVYDRSNQFGQSGFPGHYPWGLERNTYSGSFETRFGDLYTKLSLSLNDTKDYYNINPGSTAATGYNYGPGYALDAPAKAYLADWQFSSPVFSNQTLTWGFTYKLDTSDFKNENLAYWRDRDSVTGLRDRAGGDSSTWSIYVQDEIELADSLTVYLGGRMDWWKVSGAYTQNLTGAGSDQEMKRYADRSHSSFSPKAALVYRPFEETTLRLTGGKAFNTPSLYQLFATTRITGTNLYLANPELDPETVWSWDVSLTQGLWAGAEARLGYFENYMDDLISSGSTTINGEVRSRRNIAQARSRGFELEFKQRFLDHFTLAADYTYTDSKVTKDKNPSLTANTKGKRLQYVPQHLWNMSLTAEYGPVKAYLAGRYISKRYGHAMNNDSVNNVFGSYDPVFTADAKLSYDINDHLTASVTVNNIFNRHYYDGSYIAPGSSFYVDLAFHY